MFIYYLNSKRVDCDVVPWYSRAELLHSNAMLRVKGY